MYIIPGFILKEKKFCFQVLRKHYGFNPCDCKIKTCEVYEPCHKKSDESNNRKERESYFFEIS